VVLSILAVGVKKGQKVVADDESAITEQVQQAYDAEQQAAAVPEFNGDEEQEQE